MQSELHQKTSRKRSQPLARALEVQLELAKQEEEALFAAVLVKPDVLDDIVDLVDGSDFFQPEFGRAFSTIRSLYHAGEPTSDPNAIVRVLRQSGLFEAIGGHAGLAKLLNNGIWWHAKYYAMKVRYWATVRNLRLTWCDAMTALESANPDLEFVNSQLQRLVDTHNACRDSEIVTAAQAMQRAADAMVDAKQLGREPVKTGFPSIDSACGGMFQGEVIVLAARTGMGKSALSMELACRAAEAGKKTLVISLEMDQYNQGQRFLARATGIPVLAMRNSDILPEDAGKIARAVVDPVYSRISLVLSRRVNCEKLRSIIKTQMVKAGLDMIIVDHIGIVAKSHPRIEQREHVAEVTRSLKSLALEMQKPVLALSQLNRQGEDKTPGLGNLRDSGTTEEDADQVWLLHGKRGSGERILTLEKNRQGEKVDCKLEFKGSSMRWSEPELAEEWKS